MKKEKKIKKLDLIYKPKSEEQKKYYTYLNEDKNKIIVVVGPAGTGKTLFACIKAITMLKSGEFDKIIITRPVVPVEEDIGFLPGNIVKKMDPWTRPIFDIFLEFYTKSEIENLIFNGIIEISPLAYMRGRTFKNAFIIADEMQNSSPNQMIMLTTRIGVNSRMVITGDLNQTDKSKDNGLSDLLNKLVIYYKHNNNNNTNDSIDIKLVEMDKKDIERSEIVKKIINVYGFKPQEDVLLNLNKIIPYKNNKTSNVFSNNFTIQNYNVNDDSALIPKRHMFRKIWED